MIIVTVEKIDANTGERTRLHYVEIVNDGSGDSWIGNYEASLRDPGLPLINAHISGHHRADGALWLVKHAIEALVLAKAGKL